MKSSTSAEGERSQPKLHVYTRSLKSGSAPNYSSGLTDNADLPFAEAKMQDRDATTEGHLLEEDLSRLCMVVAMIKTISWLPAQGSGTYEICSPLRHILLLKLIYNVPMGSGKTIAICSFI